MAFKKINKRYRFEELWKKFNQGLIWLKDNWQRPDTLAQGRRLIKEVGDPMDKLWREIRGGSNSIAPERSQSPNKPAGEQNRR